MAAALALLTSGCSKTDKAQARGRDETTKAVTTEAVREESIHRTVEVVGTLAAVDEVTISSEAEGRVSKLLSDLGDRVKAGQALIELDNEKPQYTFDQSKAAVDSTLAKYGASDTAHLPPIEQTPDVEKAQAELGQAKQAYDRADELHKRQLVPRQTLDDADTMLRSKQASYDSALQNARNLRATIDASEAAMKLAGRQLRDTVIRAPFDGIVQKRLVNLGEYVKVQTPVMGVVRVDPLKVTAEIPEKMAPWIQNGQLVDLLVDAYRERVFKGKVSRISPSVNTATRAFAFEALVPNADAVLKPGTFARVKIVTSKIDQVLTLPYAALQYRYGVNRVFVVIRDVTGDHLSAKELKVGERFGDRVEIVSGAKAGDVVASNDVDRLNDAMKVTAAPAKDGE